MRGTLRVLLSLIGLLLAGVFGLALLVAWGVPQREPVVEKPAVMNMVDGGFSSRLLGRDELRKVFNGQPVSVSLTGAEIDAVWMDLSRRMLGGAGDVSLQDGSAELILSVPLSRTPLRAFSALGEWVNLRAKVIAEPHGLPRLASVRVGRLPVPPGLALWASQQLAAHYQLTEILDVSLASVDSVLILSDRAEVTARLPANFNTRLLGLLVPLEDHERLRAYQMQLAGLLAPAADRPGMGNLPLPMVLRPMFEQAHQRSLASTLGADSPGGEQIAARENRAILMVLALYAGQVPLGRLMPAQDGAAQVAELPMRPLTLHGRVDFVQHFLLSALLANDMGGRLTDAVGVYKEMMDTRLDHGGSGFSFNDLAADRAGIRFGQRARQQPLVLQQKVLEGMRDDFFMPAVDDLPQFLSDQAFKHLYGQVGSDAYNEVMHEIDDRVNALPVLQ